MIFFWILFNIDLTRFILFQPYTQKELPVVRVVEGPLFSEVVAYYQLFQQTIRINNVPGIECTNLQNGKQTEAFVVCAVQQMVQYNKD